MADQDETGCQQPEGPILCANNCGFFGSKATMNLCSKCYRDVVLSQAKVSSAKNALEQLLPIKQESSVSPPELQEDNIQNVMHADVSSSSSSAAAAAAAAAAVAIPAAAAAALAGGSSQETPAVARPTANRCFACNKRVGLTGFNCRCGNLFCSLHRYSDKHNCTFDYKTAGRDAIAKANPVVKADKLDKI